MRRALVDSGVAAGAAGFGLRASQPGTSVTSHRPTPSRSTPLTMAMRTPRDSDFAAGCSGLSFLSLIAVPSDPPSPRLRRASAPDLMDLPDLQDLSNLMGSPPLTRRAALRSAS